MRLFSNGLHKLNKHFIIVFNIDLSIDDFFQTELELSQFTEIFKLTETKEYIIVVRQLDEGDDYRPLLRTVKNSRSTNIILGCKIDILPEVLKQAQQVGLMVSEYNFIISNLVCFLSSLILR